MQVRLELSCWVCFLTKMLCNQRFQCSSKRFEEKGMSPQLKRVRVHSFSDTNNLVPSSIEPHSKDSISDLQSKCSHNQFLQCFNLAFEVITPTNMTTSVFANITSSKFSTGACFPRTGRATVCGGRPSTLKMHRTGTSWRGMLPSTSITSPTRTTAYPL